MPGCSAYDCSNRSEQGYRLKVFPKDPERRKLWASKVKRLNWEPTDNSFLCEVHFNEDQWEPENENGKRKLKRNAVPTLFDHSPLSVKRKSPVVRPFPHAFSQTAVSSNDSNNELRAELHKSQSENKKLKAANLLLKARLKKKSLELYKLRIKLKKKFKPLEKVFNADQIEALGQQKVSKWSNATIKTALGLKFSCGVSGYNALLANNLPYPSIRTLQRRIENIKFPSGILQEVLQLLEVKVKNFTCSQERLSNLAIDEMAITQSVEYDPSSGTYFGDATYPSQNGKAKNALVFMLGGITTRWKQVIAYYFSNGKGLGAELKNIILQVIVECHKIGIFVVNVTTDMGSSNRATWKDFGIQCSRNGVDRSSIPHPCDPTKKLTFIADVPHLIKNINSCLLANKCFILPKYFLDKYKLSSPKVESKHLGKILYHQENAELKLAPKLTLSHLENNHFHKMKVSNATAVISHEVSCALKFIAEEEKDETLKTTAWFLQHVHRWFSLMTSRHPIIAISKFNEQSYFETIAFLADTIHLFKNLKIMNHQNKIIWKPIQTGVIISTMSMLQLQSVLLGEMNVKYILTSRFTQDYVENFFSLIRSKQVVPTALQFKNNLKLICISQYFKNCSGSYENDDRELLPGFVELFSSTMAVKENLKKFDTQKTNQIALPKDWDKSPSKLSNLEMNCLFNIAGYIISRIKKFNTSCADCLGHIISDENVSASFAQFVYMKQYKSNSLIFVKEKIFLDLFHRMEILFRGLESHLITTKVNCSVFLEEKYETDDIIKTINIPTCHNIKSKIIQRFVRFRLKIFGMKKNRELKKKVEKRMSSKSCAMRDIVNNL